MNVSAAAVAGVVTCTVMVQTPGDADVPGGTFPSVKVTVRGGVIETLPPQVVEAEPATMVNTSPGNSSEISTPVNAELVGFRNVMVRVEVPPA